MKFCELSEVHRMMFESDVERLMDLSKKIKYSYDYRDSRLASLGLIDANHFELDESGDIMVNDKCFTVTDLGKILIDIAIIGK